LYFFTVLGIAPIISGHKNKKVRRIILLTLQAQPYFLIARSSLEHG